MTNRPSWDEYLMQLAYYAATRSSCPRLSVGGVLVRDHKRVIATAYNGAPALEPTCLTIGCKMQNNHCVRARHCEENLITVCARYGIAVEGTTAFITHEPCDYCCGLLSQAGVQQVHFAEHYPLRDEDELGALRPPYTKNGMLLYYRPMLGVQ